MAFQAGALLLFGDQAADDEGRTPDIVVTRIAVRNELAMPNELDQLNINESTVFPYVESSAKYIAQKFAFK